MLSRTETLISELHAWCDADYGRRSEIARILGVSAQTVSNWLARRTTPGSEETLILIEFLKDPEKHRKPRRGLK
jgi:transcriptional regulator with XRE-family HTH domain